VPLRLSALLLLVTLASCAEPRVANDEPVCTSVAECTGLYRASLVRLRACVEERRRAGYVSPGGAVPPTCDAQKAESERWASAVNRLRRQKQQEVVEEQGGGYEVPPLPSTSAPAAP
jgi:hypothetical protein